MSIEKIRNIGLDKLVTQVYNFDSLTTDELLCKFAQKINIIIEHLKYIDDRCYNSDKALEENESKLHLIARFEKIKKYSNELRKEAEKSEDEELKKSINELLTKINEQL